MRILIAGLALATLVVLAGCHSDSYRYHYPGHGHYGSGHDEGHYTHHYGSFGHGYGQHGYNELP